MRLPRLATLLLFALATACSACGGGSSAAAPGAPAPVADINVLMFGNSHTEFNQLPAMLAQMLRAARPGKTVSVVNAPRYLFLDERRSDAASLALFGSRPWQAVVLQAQRYSSSGTVSYSTDEAVEWVRQSLAIPAIPVLFPEWPRRGIDETDRIFSLHTGIAQRQPACVAPIPQAWDLARSRFPGLVLHAADGNHAAPAGSYLAALLLYASLSGDSPAALPDLPASFNVDNATQARLREVAAEQARLLSPRQYCPGAARL